MRFNDLTVSKIREAADLASVTDSEQDILRRAALTLADLLDDGLIIAKDRAGKWPPYALSAMKRGSPFANSAVLDDLATHFRTPNRSACTLCPEGRLDEASKVAHRIHEWAQGMAEWDDSQTVGEWIVWFREQMIGD